MKNLKSILAVVVGMCGFASLAFSVISIDMSYVGDAGNINDPLTGFGAVGYDYYIGTTEVTNDQYVSFLNAKGASNANGLYNASMGSDVNGGILQHGSSGSFTYSAKFGMGNKPVNFVSFWDAVRFTNWLTNGQGNGDTETGVYDLTTPGGIPNNSIVRDAAAWAAGGVAIASEDEWYKAAYYKGGESAGYWLYPNQSDSMTTADANYANSVGGLADVGSYASSLSAYGTFDQGGNVYEWNDSILLNALRGLRGGDFDSSAEFDFPRSEMRSANTPDSELDGYGFRIASLAPIPEPATWAGVLGGLALAVAMVRRRR